MIVLERSVSATRREFLHGLGLAFPGQVCDLGATLRVRDGESEMEIQLQAGPERRIAALRLPTLGVRIAFVAGSLDAQRAMLARMDLAMQRGGG
jgi:hypothetical protein